MTALLSEDDVDRIIAICDAPENALLAAAIAYRNKASLVRRGVIRKWDLPEQRRGTPELLRAEL